MAQMGSLVVSLELQQEQFQKGMDQAARQLARAEAQSKKTQSALGGLQASMGQLRQAAVAVGSAFAAMKGVEAIVKASDALKNLQGSFTALLGDANRAADMMGRVFGVVDRTGAPLEAVGASMQRLTIAMGQLGASNSQIEKVTETFLQLGKVGGSSAAETAAALQQLGQALASGKLGGDELRSIRENAPLVAEAIASAIGVTSGQLKQLGEDGQLTSDVVANALIAASSKAAAAFAKLPQSFEQAVNRMEAQATLFAAALDKSAGLSTALVATTDAIAANLKRWTSEVNDTNAQFSLINVAIKALQLLMQAVLVIFSEIAFTAEAIARSLAAAGIEAFNLLSGDWSKLGEAWKDSEARSAAALVILREYQATLLGVISAQAQFSEAAGMQARGAAKPGEAPLKAPVISGGGGGAKGKSDAEKEAEQLKKRGEALAASVDAQEAYNQKLREYDELLGKNAITQATFEKAVAAAHKELTAAGDALKASVDPYFAHQQQMELINKAYRDGQIEIEHWLALMEEANNKLKDATAKPKTEIEKLEEAAIDAVAGGLGTFFSEMVTGSISVAEAFNKMVQSIIKDLAKLLAEFAAKEAAKFIISSLFGGTTAAPGGKAAPASLMLASRPPTFNAAASLAGPSTRAGEPAAVSGSAASGSSGGPWNVVINNNAPGVGVTTNTRSDGGLDVTVEKVRNMLAQDVLRGGNAFSRSLEGAYGLGRGR